MSEATSVRQQYEQAQDMARALQNQQIRTLPEDMDQLIRKLRRIQEDFRTVSKLSNIGAPQFNEKLGKVICNLEQAARLVGDIKL